MIDKEAPDIDAAQAIRASRVVLEYLGLIPVKSIQSVLRPKPNKSQMILHYPGNPGLRQSGSSREPAKANVTPLNDGNLAWQGIELRILPAVVFVAGWSLAFSLREERRAGKYKKRAEECPA